MKKDAEKVADVRKQNFLLLCRVGRLLERSKPNEGGKKGKSCQIKPNFKIKSKSNRAVNVEM